QFEGRLKRISPHLVRAPDEPVNADLSRFYARLLEALKRPALRDGQWKLLECAAAWDGNWTNDCFIAFAWEPGEERLLAAVNYAAKQSQCYVRVPFVGLAGGRWRLTDLLGEATYDRDGDDLQDRGLFLDVPPWGASLLALKRVG